MGKPIVAYSIEAAIESNLFDEVMVSTDDEETKRIALQHGARVPFLRSNKNANDFATTYDVLYEVIFKYRELGLEFDNTCCIYPCAPFINSKILKESFDNLIQDNFDAIIPVVPFSFPIQRSFKLNNKKISYFYPEYEKTRSQDLEKAFHDAGQFYWINTKKMLQFKSLITPNTGIIELNELEVQDIDNEVDWKLAELKYKLKNEISG